MLVATAVVDDELANVQFADAPLYIIKVHFRLAN